MSTVEEIPTSYRVDNPLYFPSTHSCPREDVLNDTQPLARSSQKIGLNKANTNQGDSVLWEKSQETISKPRDLKKICFKISCKPGIMKGAY